MSRIISSNPHEPKTIEDKWAFTAHMFMKTYGYTVDEFLNETFIRTQILLEEMGREGKIKGFAVKKGSKG